MMSWLVVRLGPVQSRTSENRTLAMTQIRMARNTAKLVAVRAAPERARFRTRSRSAIRTATGPTGCGTGQHGDASIDIPTVIAASPRSRLPLLWLPQPPEITRKKTPTISRPVPSRADRCTVFG
jgi:hypothetical protein